MSGDVRREEAARDEGSPGRKRRGRRALRGLLVCLLALLALEGLGRVVAYFVHDRSEYYLLYGLHVLTGRVGISPWQVYGGEHYKFPPDYTLVGAAGQGAETARTNSLGFRGPDFRPEKPEGVFRVLCLGGSSTFGYHNEDDETYPHHLRELLAEECRGVEVVNAGFPYYNTGSILSLFREELVDYEPDVVTLYSAYNDACWPLSVSAPTRWLFWLQQHSILYLFLKETLLTDARIYQIKNRLFRKLQPPPPEKEQVLAHADDVARRFRANVEALIAEAQESGARVVLVRQPMTVREQHPGLAGTYEEEHARVLAMLEEGEFLTSMDYSMLRHHRLLEELDAIAREHDLPVVDNVAIVDEDRDRLTSWVHLTGEANLRLAEALRDALRPLIPRTHRLRPEQGR